MKLAEVRAEVVTLEGLEPLVRSGDDVPNRGNRLAQMSERLVLGSTEDSARPGEHARTEAENEATSGDAIQIQGGHRGLERAPGGGDGDATGQLDPLGHRGGGRQGNEGRPVDLRCEETLHPAVLGLLRQHHQKRCRHRPHESPVFALER